MKRFYCLLLACALLVSMVGLVQAKDEQARPTPFKDMVLADEMEPNDHLT